MDSQTDNFQMMESSAWEMANEVVNHRGEIAKDMEQAEVRFLKRKYSKGIPEETCLLALRTAVSLVQAAHRFRRTRCGSLPPTPSRRYELMLEFAKELENEFKMTDDLLKMAACRLVELYWDR